MAYNKFWVPPKPKPSIEDLSFRFLNGKYPIARIKQSYGRKITNKAVSQMAETLLMCDPDHARAKIWVEKQGRDRL